MLAETLVDVGVWVCVCKGFPLVLLNIMIHSLLCVPVCWISCLEVSDPWDPLPRYIYAWP
jgi:hypothetical protein